LHNGYGRAWATLWPSEPELREKANWPSLSIPLVSNESINIHVDNDKIYRWSCHTRKFKVACWLIEISNEFLIIDNKELIECILSDWRYCRANYKKLCSSACLEGSEAHVQQFIDDIKKNKFIQNPRLHLLNLIKKGLNKYDLDCHCVLHDIVAILF